MAKNPFQRKSKPWDKLKEQETRRRSSLLKENNSNTENEDVPKKIKKRSSSGKKSRDSRDSTELKGASQAYGDYVKSRESLRAKGRESDVSRYEGQLLLNQTLTREKMQLMVELDKARVENEKLLAQIREQDSDSDSDSDSEELQELRENVIKFKENEDNLLELLENLKKEIDTSAKKEQKLAEEIQKRLDTEEELREAMQTQLEEQQVELKQCFEQEMEEQNKLVQIEFDTQLQKELYKQKAELEAEMNEHLQQLSNSNPSSNATSNVEVMKELHNLRQQVSEYQEKISSLETQNAAMVRETKLNVALLEQQKKKIEEQQKELDTLYTKNSGTVFASRPVTSSSFDPDKNKRATKSITTNFKNSTAPKSSSIFSPVASKVAPSLKPEVGVSSLSMSPYLKLGKNKSNGTAGPGSRPSTSSSLASHVTDSPTVSGRPARVKNKPPLPLAATPRRAAQPKGSLFDSPMTSRPTSVAGEDEEAARRRTRRSLMFDSFITKNQLDASESPKRRQSSTPPVEDNKPKKRRKLGGVIVDENDDSEAKLQKQKRVKRPTVAPAAPLFADLSPEKSSVDSSSVTTPRRNPRR
ncbi:Conserved hypothetical protein [Yarrowia lipolytica]|nr:Conserved hypothetical protein [Yarrowia lipolytica]